MSVKFCANDGAQCRVSEPALVQLVNGARTHFDQHIAMSVPSVI